MVREKTRKENWRLTIVVLWLKITNDNKCGIFYQLYWQIYYYNRIINGYAKTKFRFFALHIIFTLALLNRWILSKLGSISIHFNSDFPVTVPTNHTHGINKTNLLSFVLPKSYILLPFDNTNNKHTHNLAILGLFTRIYIYQ